jgi:hypothetical protein
MVNRSTSSPVELATEPVSTANDALNYLADVLVEAYLENKKKYDHHNHTK